MFFIVFSVDYIASIFRKKNWQLNQDTGVLRFPGPVFQKILISWYLIHMLTCFGLSMLIYNVFIYDHLVYLFFRNFRSSAPFYCCFKRPNQSDESIFSSCQFFLSSNWTQYRFQNRFNDHNKLFNPLVPDHHFRMDSNLLGYVASFKKKDIK